MPYLCMTLDSGLFWSYCRRQFADFFCFREKSRCHKTAQKLIKNKRFFHITFLGLISLIIRF